MKTKINCQLKVACEQKKVSIYQLSALTGIHANQIYRYSNNQALPSIKIALILATVLKVDVNKIWNVEISGFPFTNKIIKK